MEIIILGLIMSVLGAIAYRMRGSGSQEVPKFFSSRLVRRLFCLGILAIAAIGTGAYIPVFDTVVWNYILTGFTVAIAGVLGLVIGHGSYFPNNVGGTDNERFKFITKLISDPLNNTSIFVGMALTGLLITVPVALIPGVPIWYVGFGLMKPVGYFLFYWLRSFVSFPWTESAEYSWGFWMIAGLFISSVI